jgi:hypothetical protein
MIRLCLRMVASILSTICRSAGDRVPTISSAITTEDIITRGGDSNRRIASGGAELRIGIQTEVS